MYFIKWIGKYCRVDDQHKSYSFVVSGLSRYLTPGADCRKDGPQVGLEIEVHVALTRLIIVSFITLLNTIGNTSKISMCSFSSHCTIWNLLNSNARMMQIISTKVMSRNVMHIIILARVKLFLPTAHPFAIVEFATHTKLWIHPTRYSS